jgi:hypothetical protein
MGKIMRVKKAKQWFVDLFPLQFKMNADYRINKNIIAVIV